MAVPAQPRAYSVAQVAALWGVSDTFVYDLVNAGSLAAFKLGNKLWRIRPEALDAYERDAATTPPLPAPANDVRAVADAGRAIRLSNRRTPAHAQTL